MNFFKALKFVIHDFVVDAILIYRGLVHKKFYYKHHIDPKTNKWVLKEVP